MTHCLPNLVAVLSLAAVVLLTIAGHDKQAVDAPADHWALGFHLDE